MTDRAIYTIDLDDSAFKDFADSFKRFQEEADETVSKWRVSDEIIADALKNFEQMTAPHGMAESAEHADKIATAFVSTSTSWGAILLRSKLFGGQVKTATMSLAKWTGLTSVFSTLLAGGGLWGISRLATHVSATRTSAAQYGTTYGGFESAQSSFGRLGNVSGLLNGLATSLHSAQGMGGLYSLMGPAANGLRGADTAEALAQILPHLKRFADSAAPVNLNDRIKAMGLDRAGVTPELLRMLKTMSPAEVDEMVKSYRANKALVTPSAEAQLALVEFERQMRFAGQKMENLLGENLVRLTPVVGKVAETFTEVLDKMLSSHAEQGLKWADEKIQRFADWIDSPESMAAIRQFVTDVDAAGRLFSAFVGKASSGAGGLAGAYSDFAHREVAKAMGTDKGSTGSAGRGRPSSTPYAEKKWGPFKWTGRNSSAETPKSGVPGATPSTKGGGASISPTSGESVESLAARIQQARPELESAQCVALAKAMVGSTASVTTWRRGEGAMEGTLKPGTPVATFMDRRGNPSDRYDAGGTGAPGNHTTHAAVFESYISDRGGKIAGMNVWEQYAGSGGPHRKFYPADGGFGTHSASNYHAILDENRRPLGRRNPMHPQLQGGVNHVEVHDESSGGSAVSVAHMRIGPMRGPTDFQHAFARR